MKNPYLGWAVALGLLVLVLFMQRCSGNKIDNLTETRDWLTDSLTVVQNDNGVLESSIRDLRVTNTKTLLDVEGLKGEKLRLQELVAEHKRSVYNALAINADLNDRFSGTTTIIETDTVVVGDSTFLYPVYRLDIAEEWKTGWIEANKDSVRYDLSHRLELDVVQHMKKNGLLKKKIPTVTVTSLNPDLQVTGLSSFNLESTQNSFIIGPSVGIGLGQNLQPQLQIGVHCTYRLFGF